MEATIMGYIEYRRWDIWVLGLCVDFLGLGLLDPKPFHPKPFNPRAFNPKPFNPIPFNPKPFNPKAAALSANSLRDVGAPY